MLNLFKKDKKRYYKKYRAENTALSIINIKEDFNPRARLLNSVSHL